MTSKNERCGNCALSNRVTEARMPDAKKRAGCSLSALRQCHCIGRAAGPNCRFWSEDLDGDIRRANERTAAERAPSQAEATHHLLIALAKGYGGSTCVSDGDGAKLYIYYPKREDGEAAHYALAQAIDGVSACDGESKQEKPY